MEILDKHPLVAVLVIVLTFLLVQRIIKAIGFFLIARSLQHLPKDVQDAIIEKLTKSK